MRRERSAVVAMVVTGIGMGGFVDGIVLHQILQWHNMVSNVYPPDTMENMRINMVWDGLFHAAMWLVTLAGVVLLWRAARRGDAMPAARGLVGALVFGWGLFNLVEGVIDHEILAIHYVRAGPAHTAYNMAFLALGGIALLALGGWMLRGRSRSLSFMNRR